MENVTLEIVLRVSGGSDYCTFEIEAETSLVEVENMIVDMLDWNFNRISGPDDKEV